MKIERKDLLENLQTVSIGLNPKETIIQSNCFVFDDVNIITFNDEIKATYPHKIEGIKKPFAVVSTDLLHILERFPDETIEVAIEGNELQIKGKRRSAGLTISEVSLPYTAIEFPKDGQADIPNGVLDAIRQATRVCREDLQDAYNAYEKLVHILPNYIEATDGHRYFKFSGKTGFEKEILISAASAAKLPDLQSVCIKDNWAHFKAGKLQVSVRAYEARYPNCSDVAKIADPKEIKLPPNLNEVVSRAEIMQDLDRRVTVVIKKDLISIKSQKEGGWFKEQAKAEYKGPELTFDVNSELLHNILKYSNTVTIPAEGGRLAITSKDINFIVALMRKPETETKSEKEK